MTQKQTQVVKINIYNDSRAKRRQPSQSKPYSGIKNSVAGGGGIGHAFNNTNSINSEIARNYLRQIENPFDQRRYINNLLDDKLTPKLNIFGARFLQSADNRYALKSNLYQDDAGNFQGEYNPLFESQRVVNNSNNIGIPSDNLISYEGLQPQRNLFSPIQATESNLQPIIDEDVTSNYANYSQPSYITSENNPMMMEDEFGLGLSLELPNDLLKYVENSYAGYRRRARQNDIQLYHYLTNTPYDDIDKLKIDYIRRRNTKILRDNGLL